MLLDTGAEANLINDAAAIQFRLRKAPNADTPTIVLPDGSKTYCYSTYETVTNLKDDWGTEHRTKVLLYGVPDLKETVILGIPALQAMRVTIDCETKAWRFKLRTDRESLRLEEPEEFAQSLQHEATVYAMVMNHVGEQVQVTLPPQLSEFADVADSNAADALPKHHGGEHSIEIEHGKEAPYGPLYNLSPKELEVLRDYIVTAKENKWIRESISPAGAPVLFVPKKDGTLRLCVDYRGLNAVTKKNRLALPLISETLDRLSGCSQFTKLDLKNAYHRIRIREGDEWKTAFRTRYGHFEYTVMPFGLCNAPATFQAYINKALAGITDVFCVVYLDDILIFSKEGEDHWDHVKQVLRRLRKFNLYVNLKKCVFAVKEVEFLGFLVNTEGVKMDPRRVDAIQKWPLPRSFRDIQVFLGFANFYRRFIRNFSKIAKPLTDLLRGSENGKKTGPFEWPPDAEEAMRHLCDAFTTAPMLRHYDPTLPSRLETDASIIGLGVAFSQLFDDGIWHPVAFWSRKLSAAEKNYPTGDQEMLAIYEGISHFRHYVEGLAQKFVVWTDHDNLKTFLSKRTLSRMQNKWAVELGAYDFEIKHRPGATNPADGLSRRPLGWEGEEEPQDMMPALRAQLMPDEPAVQQEGEPTAKQKEAYAIPKLVQTGPETLAFAVRTTRAQAKRTASEQSVYDGPTQSLQDLIGKAQANDAWTRAKIKIVTRQPDRHFPWVVQDNVLFHGRRYFVPAEKALRQQILFVHHDDPFAGHFGKDKTQNLVAKHYYWPAMENEVAEYTKTCHVCQSAKAVRRLPAGELQPLPLPEKPWTEITMDFVTGFPPVWHRGEVVDAVWVIVDRLTKMARYVPCSKKTTASDLATLFLHEIVRCYGTPTGIVSDRGSVFTSHFWADFCHACKIERRLSTAFHPQTDGQTERQNQTLEQYLRMYADEDQQNWASLLPLAEFAYNNSVHKTTGSSPFFALMGYHPEIGNKASPRCRVPSAEERAKEAARAQRRAKERWEKAQEYQERYFNKHHRSQEFKIDDLVMLSTKHLRRQQPSAKLTPQWIGPFRVQDIIGRQAYKLILPTDMKIHPVIHTSRLKPYEVREGEMPPLPTSLPLVEEGDELQYEVERIIDVKGRRRCEYLIKWKDWPDEYNQWVPEQDIDKDLISNYKNENQTPTPAQERNASNTPPAYHQRRRGRYQKRLRG